MFPRLAASKDGKTEFARRMIHKLAARIDVVGVKVTTIREVGGDGMWCSRSHRPEEDTVCITQAPESEG